MIQNDATTLLRTGPLSTSPSHARAPRGALSRYVRDFAKARLRGVFEAGQRVGLDILPRHYYSSVPDVRALRSHSEWKAAHPMVGVDGSDLDKQTAVLAEWCGNDVHARIGRGDIWQMACAAHGEPGYGPIDADVLWAFVTARKPKKVIQVGAGVSTAVMLAAADEAGHDVEIVCIDPYPTHYLLSQAHAGRITLITERAQDVARHHLLDVEAQGLLFVDSSHTVMPGSEVNRLVLDIIPCLRDGVMVHFHDITFPFNYQRGLLSSELFFSSESTLLHAFLVHNRRCRLRLSLSMLHHGRPEELRKLVPEYRPQANDQGLRPARAPLGTHFRALRI